MYVNFRPVAYIHLNIADSSSQPSPFVTLSKLTLKIHSASFIQLVVLVDVK